MRPVCPGWLALTLLAAIVPALAGCGEDPKVTTYETPATEKFRTVVDVAEVRAGTDHMLAAIIAEKAADPQQSQAWFFKLVARGEGLDPLRKSFDEFLSTVKLNGAGKTPSWTLPEGWGEKPASAMRVATIEIPYEGKTLELAVSSLPLTADWEEFRKVNIDRWVGQMQQSKLSADEIAKLVKEKPTADDAVQATFIELIGVMQPMSGAMPGVGGMPAGHPPVAGADSSSTTDAEMPAGTAPAAAAPNAPPVAATTPPMRQPMPPMGGGGTPATEMPKPKEFTYTPPEGWQPGVMSSMRTAAFNVVDGDQKAEVTVMPFPATGMMGDPVAQAQRWAGQVGLTMSPDEVKAASKPLQISGADGESFELLGPDSEAKPMGILAAMVKQGDMVWFFKMTGDRTLVEAQREPFNKFIESIKFAGDGK
ncbi:hypothetical protein [Lacipirellula sp.]|uniref:hypothetical protein n=1 Tax=Lacipirellula sp. TaxID=2691419 RepID=UPI003D0EFFB5